MANQKISVESLAADESFQRWVLHPSPEADEHWSRWIRNHPEHKHTVSQAKQLLLNLHLKADTAPSELQQQVWAKVKPVLEESTREHKVLSHQLRSKVAASVAVLLAASVLFSWYYFSTNSSYRTAYGETQEIVLPDGSLVTLNANSSIHFASNWDTTEVREVWLEGEAFFDVRHIPLANSSSNVRLPFVVHSQNMDVEVLGTTFNVKDRTEYSEVVLNTGKVSVTPQLEQQTAPIAMSPGDRLAYSASKQEWEIQQVNPAIPTAWRNHELIFDEMPIEEIAQILEDAYGYTITFETEDIKHYSFTGNIKTDEIEMLIPMLERSFDLAIQQQGKRMSFAKK
ncbi:FecR family protein [Tunicatimonas pelagia]|uniref:FecR family protein n=1 Tax=Tunicatimonas pelagia TaxID=931531 RepID=UPI0026669DFF|nr:FecR family protein [Tunicatimonas pelagia]WKN44538.1 FecR domain-containing protein [Tunicatimonas pelagia]